MNTREINPAPARCIKDIDWAGIWHRQMAEATFSGKGADFWDNWARSLPAKTEHSGYVEELLSRLDLTPQFSVLDVGAGTGALAIPMAQKAHSVTALDQSPAMLKSIMQKAAAEGIRNITTLNLDWNSARVNADFQKHDVVVVSRSLPSGDDIRKSLRSINDAANHSCYITWKANGHDDLEYELSRQLGIKYAPFPEHAVLYNLLCSMDIPANIELFQTNGTRQYISLEDAYIQVIRSHPVDAAERIRIMSFLADRLNYRDGSYYQPKNTTWALIWWKKINAPR